MYFSKVAHLISLLFSFSRKKAINRRPICPQCRQEINMKLCKTIYFSFDRRHCSGCTTSQTYADGLRKQLEEKDKSNDEIISGMEAKSKKKDKKLNEIASKYSESQELIAQKNESLSQSEKNLIAKENQLVLKQQVVDFLENEILKIKELLIKNDKLLEEKKK